MPIRGGNWYNDSNAGLAALNLNYERSNSNSNIGFRPALACRQIGHSHGNASSAQAKGALLLCHRHEQATINIGGEYLKKRKWPIPIQTEVFMPITYNNLWDPIVNFENLFKGYCAAARGRRYKDAVLGYHHRLEENIINALNLLAWKQWEPSRFKEFFVFDPKKRLISAPPFKDRVVHHALVQIIAPLFERKFIADSFACREGKGTHAAKQRVEFFANEARKKWGEYYVLKGDIRAYFYSIDRHTLLKIIERTISDTNVLWLIKRIIEYDDDEQGIPIGALTSQLFANIYLDALDHHLKDNLGVKMYARYMDDFVIIHKDKGYLTSLLADIDAFITDRLHLTLNPKTTIFKSGAGVCHAIDFCGYRIWPGHTKPRKRTVKAARKRFKKLSELYKEGKLSLSRVRASITSFTGYMKHCNGILTLESTLASVVFSRSSADQVSTILSPYCRDGKKGDWRL